MTFAGHAEAEFTLPSGIEIAVTTNAGGPTNVPITAGTYFHAAFAAQLQADLEAGQPVAVGNWSVSYSATTGLYTISVDNSVYSITWTSTDLRDLLGFAGDVAAQTSATGTQRVRGVWRPDCPLIAQIDARRSPLWSDHRNTVSPTGVVLGFVSNRMYRHQGIIWSHVPLHRVWEASAIAAGETNASYERWVQDTQLGLGHPWFAISSRIRLVDHTGTGVGVDALAGGLVWQIPRLPGLDTLRQSDGISNGIFYAIEWPEIVAVVS